MILKNKKLEEIKPNKYSTRKEFDVESLAKSISEIGLESTIAIDENNELIYGERRLNALLFNDVEEAEVKLFEGLTAGSLDAQLSAHRPCRGGTMQGRGRSLSWAISRSS